MSVDSSALSQLKLTLSSQTDGERCLTASDPGRRGPFMVIPFNKMLDWEIQTPVRHMKGAQTKNTDMLVSSKQENEE